MFLNQLFGPRETSEYVRGAVRFRQKVESKPQSHGCKPAAMIEKPDLAKLAQEAAASDGMENLKNKARRERGMDTKAHSFWSMTEAFSVMPAPSVDKEAREKAIRELLSIGTDHYSQDSEAENKKI